MQNVNNFEQLNNESKNFLKSSAALVSLIEQATKQVSEHKLSEDAESIKEQLLNGEVNLATRRPGFRVAKLVRNLASRVVEMTSSDVVAQVCDTVTEAQDSLLEIYATQANIRARNRKKDVALEITQNDVKKFVSAAISDIHVLYMSVTDKSQHFRDALSDFASIDFDGDTEMQRLFDMLDYHNNERSRFADDEQTIIDAKLSAIKQIVEFNQSLRFTSDK